MTSVLFSATTHTASREALKIRWGWCRARCPSWAGSSTPSRSLQVGATRGRQKPMPEGPPVKGNLMHFDQTETAHFSQMVGLLNFFWGKWSFYWLSSLKLLKMILFDFTSQLNWKQKLKMPVFTLFSSSKKYFLKNMYTPEMDVSCLNRSQLW